LVAFGTYADTISPLTLDHANLISIVADLEVADEQGESATAVGEGLGLAVERLRVHAAKSKVVVLLTDGVNNAGALEPSQAAELARQHHIKVYTVGAGSTGMAPIPVRMANGQTVLRPRPMQMDARTLKRIAATTDGHYFHARDAHGLAQVYAQIDALERSAINDVKYLHYREHYVWWVLAAFGWLALAQLLHSTWLARLP
jgi:Ca-activated chloride channel family protein